VLASDIAELFISLLNFQIELVLLHESLWSSGKLDVIARGSRGGDFSLLTTQVFEIFPANSERSERITTEGDS